MKRVLGLLAAGVLLSPAPALADSLPPDGGRVLAPSELTDHVSPELRRELSAAAGRNIARLRAEGKLPPIVAPKMSGLVWPLGPSPGIGADWHGISHFVDLDKRYPNFRLDYTCRERTYDLQTGNHNGIDYLVWPFPWMLMDTGAIDVRAVATGILVHTHDGEDDRSCSGDPTRQPNVAMVLHADGSVAYYLHLKRGSVTPLPIGSRISAGQAIGKVGSSGFSTVPHLHLELRASEAFDAAAIEPHRGACNDVPSAWAEQRPYLSPAINRLSTHSAAPESGTCEAPTMRGTDEPHFLDRFQPGEQVTLLAAYRDQVFGSPTQYRLLRPDLGVQAAWEHGIVGDPDAYFHASYWYWTRALPADAPHGLWQFEATFQGKTKRHYFRVGNTTTAIGDMKGLIGAWFEPTTSGQGFELHWINDGIALLFFYGHQDDGDNFFLLGQRNGAWDFGQEVVFNMHRATGGRWTDIDPALISRPLWGTARITFVDCETAVVELDGVDGTQVLNLERLGRTKGLECG